MKRSLIIGSAAAAGAVAYTLLRPRAQMDLNGKVVLITGGSKGLGLALAREFAGHGARPVLCARNESDLEFAKRDLVSRGADPLTFVCDVSDQKQVKQLIASTLAKAGRIDVLVNNAGVIRVGPVHTMNLEDFEEAMDVMFWGTVYTSLEALPHFQSRGSGHIVNITSVGGKVSVPHLLPYSCAKFAAVAFSEGLRAELRRSPVTVTTIAPGLMRTGSHLNAIFKGAEKGEAGWFSASASMPGLSMSAARAARQIVAALRRGRAERILGIPANIAARLHSLAPELAVDALGLAGGLLPNGSDRVEKGAESPLLRRPWMRALTVLGRRAARDLQPAAPQS